MYITRFEVIHWSLNYCSLYEYSWASIVQTHTYFMYICTCISQGLKWYWSLNYRSLYEYSWASIVQTHTYFMYLYMYITRFEVILVFELSFLVWIFLSSIVQTVNNDSLHHDDNRMVMLELLVMFGYYALPVFSGNDQHHPK